MPFLDVYRRQVDLVLRTLPYVAEEDCFALKGGTAINLFVRNLPRLSVDIDLTFLPLADRNESLQCIEEALMRIAENIEDEIPDTRITPSSRQTQSKVSKLIVVSPDRVRVKIEVNPVLRGAVYESQLMTVTEAVEDQFGFAEIAVLSFADLFAGKVLAALDRQHPRDLFDIHLLLQNEGITEKLRAAFIVYLIGHNHSPNKLLSAKCRDINHEYQHNFRGMTEYEVPIDALTAAHAGLIDDLVANMPKAHKEFLLSFYRREPDWAVLGLDGVQKLPAITWREQKLDNAGQETREEIVSNLEQVLQY